MVVTLLVTRYRLVYTAAVVFVYLCECLYEDTATSVIPARVTVNSARTIARERSIEVREGESYILRLSFERENSLSSIATRLESMVFAKAHSISH